MLTLWGARQRFCDGITRRNFLKIGAFGAGLTLADMLRLQARASTTPNQAAARSRPKSAIMIYLPGGPSHMDMYDLKPDAPAEFRGEFRPIQTNVSGVQICEHFPLQARMWDKFACIRSIVSVDEHSDSLVMTGKSSRENMTANHPCFGSVVSRVRAAQQSAIPSFQQKVSSLTVPAPYASTISAEVSVRWSPSPTFTVQVSAALAAAPDAAGLPPDAPSCPLTTIVEPHFLHLILTTLPRTFSSAIVYLA